ncbi:hypothetical protein AB6A40_002933 [Gnathostoma spinigerum]|uniref:Uncharacterized protein n=1 Tax=Gnathostoma spinigerum TaxID=75299 RepID=A0ABD6EDJ5_9BILA
MKKLEETIEPLIFFNPVFHFLSFVEHPNIIIFFRSPIVTFYGSENQARAAAAIIPTILTKDNYYLSTIIFKKSGERRVVYSSYFTPSAVSTESGSVVQLVYQAPLLPHDIVFAIGNFKYEAKSAGRNTLVRVLCAKTIRLRTVGFVMDEVRNMASAMEEKFGKSLVDSDLCILMVPGMNVFRASPCLLVIGTEHPAYSSPLLLWRIIRETVVAKWFISTAVTRKQKTVLDGAVSYLVASLVDGEGADNSEGWASALLSKQLSNSLPLDVNERMLDEGNGMKLNTISLGPVLEMIANLIGKETMNDALNTFLLEVRRKGSASLLEILQNFVFQRGTKDWCGRPFSVTNFFNQWITKAWPKSGVPVTKFLLHVVVDDRENLSTAPSNNDYPPIPIFIRSLKDTTEWIVWRSQECPIIFSADEGGAMAQISNSDVIVCTGSPGMLRMTYEESGTLGYPTMISKISSQRKKISISEQLVFVADRLHFLLTERWSPDYDGIIRLMHAFLRNNVDFEIFVLFLPAINRLHRIMAGTHREEVFIEYIYDLLETQYFSLWWEDCGDSRRNLHRRILFPLAVRWDFVTARVKAMQLLNEFISRGNPLNPDNKPLSELSESAFCAAVIQDVRYFYFFHEVLLNATDESRGENYLYAEITRSLACATDEAAIASLVDAFFLALESESRQQHRGITTEQYINILGENSLSMNGMLARLLIDKNAARMLYEAGLLRPYLTAMTNFCYLHQCLEQVSQLHFRNSENMTELQGIYTEYSDMVFRRNSHIHSIIGHIKLLMATISL